ncbi:MAG: neutral/alkaline non-lysosomal ceramidase N-terminal domain-containing protein [Verrucomicrobiae bacterium]|nr:neutral/alkaline non-lysosomal ceramidase N-terminal domain-containing protein [Verrucomicrobiae bacterium]
MTPPIYRVGIAREIINPPLGIRLCGYALREGVSNRILDDLSVTALAIQSRESLMVLMGADLTMLSPEFANALRAHCAKLIGTLPKNILINVGHTHSAPVMDGYIPYDVTEQIHMQDQYAALVFEKCGKACQEAVSKMQAARMGSGWGELRANVNRRQKMQEGEVYVGENHQGECDSSVGVIRFDDLKGNPLAVAFRYSCHPVTLGYRSNVISADYIGAARGTIESGLGCLSLFLQGCAGNLNPLSGIGASEEDFDETRRLGRMLGAETIKVAESIRTHKRRSQPKIVRSMATFFAYAYEEYQEGGEGPLSVLEREFELPLAPLPSYDVVLSEMHDYETRMQNGRRANAPESVQHINNRYVFWAAQRAQTLQQKGNPVRVRFSVHVVRIGPILLLTMPFEPMAETGLALRQLLRGHETFVLGYTNGVISYLPTPQISREGGLEAQQGYKNYLLPAEVPGVWETTLRSYFVTHVQKHDKFEPPVREEKQEARIETGEGAMTVRKTVPLKMPFRSRDFSHFENTAQ